jgi:UDP-glucose 4-epimerase
MIRLAGRPQLPIASPLFAPLTGAARRLGLDVYSDDFRRLLRYGRAVDIRRLEDEVGHRPRFSTVAAVEDWVGSRREAAAA